MKSDTLYKTARGRNSSRNLFNSVLSPRYPVLVRVLPSKSIFALSLILAANVILAVRNYRR